MNVPSPTTANLTSDIDMTQFQFSEREMEMLDFSFESNEALETDDQSVHGLMLSQDLYSLIDSFYIETQMENFDNGDAEAFQFVIDDVIDALPSSDDFNFLDRMELMNASDVPVKNNSSCVTGTASVYTCATENDGCCARTSSTTLSTKNTKSTWDALSPAENALLAELSGFLENNSDSSSTCCPSICPKVGNGCLGTKKRGHDSDEIQILPSKRLRAEDPQTVFEHMVDNDISRNACREKLFARAGHECAMFYKVVC